MRVGYVSGSPVEEQVAYFREQGLRLFQGDRTRLYRAIDQLNVHKNDYLVTWAIADLGDELQEIEALFQELSEYKIWVQVIRDKFDSRNGSLAAWGFEDLIRVVSELDQRARDRLKKQYSRRTYKLTPEMYVALRRSLKHKDIAQRRGISERCVSYTARRAEEMKLIPRR